MRQAAIALMLLLVVSTSGHAQELEANYLKVVGDFADNFCVKVPMEGSSSSLEISGEARAEISALLKKLTDMGIRGAAKYQQSHYEGFLQKDLLTATRDRTECKLKVLNILAAKLLAATADPYRLPSSARDELAALVIEGDNMRQEWIKRMLTGSTESQEEVAQAVLAWHGRVANRLKLPPMGPQYLARFRNQIRHSGGYPGKINTKVAGVWDLLHSDMQRLDEFMKER